MNMIAKLFQDFQALPDDFTVKGKAGTGPFARETNPKHPCMQKIILSGDTKRDMACNLWYLLYDLAVDCAWNSEQIKQLNAEFFGPLATGEKWNQEVTPITPYQRAQRKLASIIKKAARERDAKGYRENLGYDQYNKFQVYLNQLDLTYSQRTALLRQFDAACDKL